MSCEKFEIELYETFGTDMFSTELLNHLETCASCKEMFENLQSTVSQVGSDESFYESDSLVEKRVEAVNRKIDELEIIKVTSPAKWKAYVPMAAAIFLVLGIGLISKFVLSFDSTTEIADLPQNELQLVSLTEDDTKSLNELEISEFIDEYTTEYTLENEMLLLDDISDEEYKYLEENLNIGEIL